MSAAPTNKERLTSSKLHGVLSAISIGMIGQLVSASQISSELKFAAFVFSISLITNTFLYIFEADSFTREFTNVFAKFFYKLIYFTSIMSPIVAVHFILRFFSESMANVSLALVVLLAIALFAFLVYFRLTHLDISTKSFKTDLDAYTEQLEVVYKEMSELIKEREKLLEQKTDSNAATILQRSDAICKRLIDLKLNVSEIVRASEEYRKNKKAEFDIAYREVMYYYPLLPRQ